MTWKNFYRSSYKNQNSAFCGLQAINKVELNIADSVQVSLESFLVYSSLLLPAVSVLLRRSTKTQTGASPKVCFRQCHIELFIIFSHRLVRFKLCNIKDHLRLPLLIFVYLAFTALCYHQYAHGNLFMYIPAGMNITLFAKFAFYIFFCVVI